jgi:DNA-binding NtrC family response regulator
MSDSKSGSGVNGSIMYILHIEDDSDIASAMERLLRREFGAKVVTATSGEAAIKAVNSTEFDLVISDWNIEGSMTGGDIYNLIQVEYPKVSSRYMFMSDSRLAELLCAAADLEFVEKPSTTHKILEAVRTTLGKPA